MQQIIVEKDNAGKKIALIEKEELLEWHKENENTKRLEGNIYIGKIQNVLKGMQAAFVDIGTNKNTFIHLKDILPKIDITKETQEKSSEKDIQNVVKQNMPIMVQVKRDATDKKGARVSTHISLASRFFVLMPDTNIITVSQKIEEDEKIRLKEMIGEYLPEGMGIIIRTSAKEKDIEILKKDLETLLGRWKRIKEKAKQVEKYPCLIEEDTGILQKMILDTVDHGMEEIHTNSKEEYSKLEEVVKNLGLENKIRLFLEEKLILQRYDLIQQVEKLNNRKIWLKCGGFITIDKTEALTAIDVNTGKYVGKESLEKTVLEVNKEASAEIAKQIRLRDIGGILIIDFIDMELEEDKQEVISVLEERLKSDRSKTQVLGFTKLNLVEMTRKHICSNEVEGEDGNR